jgi:hypothetical protein
MLCCHAVLQHLRSSGGSGSGGGGLHLGSTAKLRADLSQHWDELKTPVAERVAMLSQLLDSAGVTPGTLAVYESISAKLADRAPLAQLLNRKQFLEYKLKLSARTMVTATAGAAGDSNSGGSQSMSTSERAELIAELSETKAQIERLAKHYEKAHGEPFQHPSHATETAAAAAAGAGFSPKK